MTRMQVVKGLEGQLLYTETRNKLVIVCSKGSLDMAYPPLMLATSGAAMGMEVDLYFTFWGINMIRKKTVDNHLIAASSKHVFQPGNLDVAFRGADPSKFIRTERELVDQDVNLIEDQVELISLANRTVQLGSGTILSYDYLVLATGSIANPAAIPGLKEASLNFHTSGDESRKVWDALEQFDGGHVVVGIAGVPHKCPPSPDEAVFLLDDRLRERGVRDKAKITFLTPYPRPYPAEPMSKVVEPRLNERDIELVTFFNVDSVDPVKKELYSLEGETVSYDLLIMVPPHRGADVIIKSGIGDKDGWIPTDKNTMRIKGQENVYALGD